MRVRFQAEARDGELSRLMERGGFAARLRRGARAALDHDRVRVKAELNVIWTSPSRIRALNRRFRRTDRFTDVIAFRYEAPPAPLKKGAAPFGDLYISVAQARKNAAAFGVPFAEEVLRLVVHGTLHLLGYTDYAPKEKARMWAVQEAIVRRLSPRPR